MARKTRYIDALEDNPPQRPWRQRLGWLLLIWVLSIAALAGFAAVLRVVMGWVGLTA